MAPLLVRATWSSRWRRHSAGRATVAAQPIAGRALPVTLTDAGQSILDQADEIVLDVEKRMVASLPPGEVQRLASLLTACARSLT
jgi:hypothetical protein